MKIDTWSWACGRRVLMASLVTLAAAGVLAADQAAAQDVKRGGTLVIARPEEPLSWNPYTQGDNGSIYAIEQVCDLLVEADATGRGLRPGLAESWEMSPTASPTPSRCGTRSSATVRPLRSTMSCSPGAS